MGYVIDGLGEVTQGSTDTSNNIVGVDIETGVPISKKTIDESIIDEVIENGFFLNRISIIKNPYIPISKDEEGIIKKYSDGNILDTLIRTTIQSYQDELLLKDNLSNLFNSDSYQIIINSIEDKKKDISIDLEFLKNDHILYTTNIMMTYIYSLYYMNQYEEIANKISDNFYNHAIVVSPKESISIIESIVRKISSISNLVSLSSSDYDYIDDEYSTILEYYDNVIKPRIDDLDESNTSYIKIDGTNPNLNIDKTINFPIFSRQSDLTDFKTDLDIVIVKLNGIIENFREFGGLLDYEMKEYIDDIINLMEESTIMITKRSLDENSEIEYELTDNESSLVDTIEASSFLLLGVFKYDDDIIDVTHINENGTISAMFEVVYDIKKESKSMLLQYWRSFMDIIDVLNTYSLMFVNYDEIDDDNIIDIFIDLFLNLNIEEEYNEWISYFDLYTKDTKIDYDYEIINKYTPFDEITSRLYFLSYKFNVDEIYNSILTELLEFGFFNLDDLNDDFKTYMTNRDDYEKDGYEFNENPDLVSISHEYKTIFTNINYCENMPLLESIDVDDNLENGYIKEGFLNTQSFLIFKNIMADLNNINELVLRFISSCIRNDSKNLKELSVELSFINLIENISSINFSSEANDAISEFVLNKNTLLNKIEEHVNLLYDDNGITDIFIDIFKDGTRAKNILTLNL
jgi:hypothetical protein